MYMHIHTYTYTYIQTYTYSYIHINIYIYIYINDYIYTHLYVYVGVYLCVLKYVRVSILSRRADATVCSRSVARVLGPLISCTRRASNECLPHSFAEPSTTTWPQHPPAITDVGYRLWHLLFARTFYHSLAQYTTFTTHAQHALLPKPVPQNIEHIVTVMYAEQSLPWLRAKSSTRGRRDREISLPADPFASKIFFATTLTYPWRENPHSFNANTVYEEFWSAIHGNIKW